MYWNRRMFHLWEKRGFGRTITLDVLKYTPCVKVRLLHKRRTITLDVLKSSVWSHCVFSFRMKNHNIRCIEIFAPLHENRLLLWKNHNIRCIEIWLSFTKIEITFLKNHNIRCIEMLGWQYAICYLVSKNHNIRCIEISFLFHVSCSFVRRTITLDVLK